MRKPKSKAQKRMFKIRHKIILVIYLIIFPVLMLTGGVIYYRNYASVMNDTSKQYQGVVDAVSKSVMYMEQDLADIATYFAVNFEINKLLSSTASMSELDPLFWSKQAPTGVIKDILAIKSNIRTMALFPENGITPFYLSRDASVHNTDINEIRELEIYKSSVEAKGDMIWRRINADEKGLFIKNKSDKIVVCRELFDLSKKKRLGFLALSMDVMSYDNLCKSAILQDNESMLVLNDSGMLVTKFGSIEDSQVSSIISMDKEKAAKSQGMTLLNDDYIFSSYNEVSNCSIYYLTPKSNWDDWTRNGLAMPIILGLVLLICIWPISAFASRIISKPLLALYASMNKFKEGDFNQQVEISSNDEMSELSETFNKMVNDLRELIEKNYVIALREKESELAALQAQINPHFLYNALDSLYWQAVESGDEKLSDDILALSDIFRLTLSSGESLIPVKREIDIISSYFKIQKMRFAKKLDYSIEVDEDMMDFIIPKLILQPFVENAIIHGLEKKETWGFVKITGKIEGSYLRFTIEDNGAGMSDESLNNILYMDEDKKYANQRIGKYAIRNVKERMILRYGDNFVLKIESKLGEGTKVIIKTPIEKSEMIVDDKEQ